MIILALDTSTANGGVAVLRDETPLAAATWEREGSHGEHLTPHIEQCLKDSKLEPRQIDAIVLGRGPGSFTGVRIAVNAARSLAFALNRPVFAYDTSEILAYQATLTERPVLVLINAHKNLLFSSTFNFDSSSGFWQRRIELEARGIEQIETLITEPHLCVGDGFNEYEEVFSSNFRSLLIRSPSVIDFPHPVQLGLLFWKTRHVTQPLAWKEVQALYIRASGAEEKLRESLGKKGI